MPRRVVVAGASGLIGAALVDSLRADGAAVTRLVRRPAQAPDEVEWLTGDAPLDPAVLEGADAVVGFNGASIGRFPWTAAYKHTLVWSRIAPTQALARAVRELGADAPAFVASSAVGFYGSAPRGVITEESPKGDSFLADLCGEWESAARGAGPHARVSLLRTAPVVHADGVLKPLLLLTKLGVSGPIGRGTQIWPWISLDDEVAGIRHVIAHDIDGPVNLTGPTPAHANDLGFALAVRLNRPYLVRAPEWALRLALGSDATEALLTTDADVRPDVLESTGFTFAHRTVEDAVAAAVPAAEPATVVIGGRLSELSRRRPAQLSSR
ncbi:MAG TPA: TIGR01777 family oxidoreductase [Microbacterium sp.]|nr:TIGR01777 family oxidoreductase [Microbacterium sp.]